MILPGSFTATLVLLVLGALLLGSWANTLKSTRDKWRFELFYFDFAIGVFVAAIVAGLTIGSFGFDGFSFTDDMRLAGKREDLFALVSGVVFNLGNMLLAGAISVSGMAAAIPVGLGFALIVTGIWSAILGHANSLGTMAIGAAVVLGAVAMLVLANRMTLLARLAREVELGKTKSTKMIVSSKGPLLAAIAGLFLGSFAVLLNMSAEAENGLGPYSRGFVFATGILLSTFVFNLFFMNLPVKGEPIDVVDYFRGGIKRHGLGFLGGILFYSGFLLTLVAARADGKAAVPSYLRLPIEQSAMIVALLWGFLAWREFDGSDSRVKLYLIMSVLLLAGGISLFSLARI